MRLAPYFTYHIYLFSFPLLICPFSYVAHVVGGSSQKVGVHSRYRNYRNQFRKCTHFRYPTDNQLRNPSQWRLYRKIMPVAYRLSEIVRKKELAEKGSFKGKCEILRIIPQPRFKILQKTSKPRFIYFISLRFFTPILEAFKHVGRKQSRKSRVRVSMSRWEKRFSVKFKLEFEVTD